MHDQDRLRGMFLGLVYTDAIYTSSRRDRHTKALNLCLSTPTNPSGSLMLAEVLSRYLINHKKYTYDVLIDYSKSYVEMEGPNGLDDIFDRPDMSSIVEGFEGKFGVSFDEPFEDVPKYSEDPTGVYQRSTVLSTLFNLDALILDVWVTDPHVETFGNVWTYTNTLRRLLSDVHPSECIEHVPLECDGSIDLVRFALSNPSIERFISTLSDPGSSVLSRDDLAILGATYGAMLGYDELMGNPTIRLSARMLKSRLTED